MLDYKKILSKKNPKNFIIICALVALIGFILLLSGNNSSKDSASASLSESSSSLEEEVRRTEEKISALCQSVKGAGRVMVSVTLESGSESVYASSDGNYIVVGSGSSKNIVYITEKSPKIQGIGIVCEGGDNPDVVCELLSLISAAYGVPTHKIYIAASK